jgi:sarcosine oxidase delta subunit
MLRIECPWCGVRNEDEFSYGGDATVERPADDASQDDWRLYPQQPGRPASRILASR